MRALIAYTATALLSLLTLPARAGELEPRRHLSGAARRTALSRLRGRPGARDGGRTFTWRCASRSDRWHGYAAQSGRHLPDRHQLPSAVGSLPEMATSAGAADSLEQAGFEPLVPHKTGIIRIIHDHPDGPPARLIGEKRR